MVDFNNIWNQFGQGAVNMLFGQGQQYQQPAYRGIPGHTAQYYTYNPSWVETGLNWLFPGSQYRMAPPNFLQQDFDYLRQRTQQEQVMRSQFNYSPVARQFGTSALQMFGFDQNQASAVMQNPLVNFGTTFLSNMMFGKSAYQQAGDVSVDMSRFFSGRRFADTSGMFRFGISPEVNQDLTQKLFGATFKDDLGMFRRNQFFGMRDMGDIMKRGIHYGLGIPTNEAGQLNTDQLIEQTKSLAKTIEIGMGVYRTQSFCVKSWLTSGDIPNLNIPEVSANLLPEKNLLMSTLTSPAC